MCNINRILARPEHTPAAKYGAQLGRRDKIGEPAKLHVQRLALIDGDYDTGGVYWGSPADIWCGFSEDAETLAFVRAESRAHAIDKLRDLIVDRTGDEAGFEFHTWVAELTAIAADPDNPDEPDDDESDD